MGVPESDVGDVYVDVLMKVYGKIGSFRCGGPAKLTTWIYGIAKNAAVDYHRSSTLNRISTGLDDQSARYSKGSDGACAGRNVELLKWLDRELTKLSEQDQALLKWRTMEIPYAHIGEWLGMSEGTARVRHQRAMQKLLTASKSVVSEGGVPQ
jgi:RNA polymerase sigma factor (sigma-70 family)